MSELIELQTFVAVAQSGSFAAAARRLGLTPALVGRRIQSLESRHGVKLIERTTRAQRLTALGEAFREKASAVIETLDALNDLTRPDAGQLTGRIRMTAATTIGILRLAAILGRFAERHPSVVVEMSLNDRRVDLISGGFDLAVRIGELTPSSLIAKRVGTYSFVCCAAPDYLTRFGTPQTPEELAEARCILNLNLVPRNLWPFVDPGGQRRAIEVQGAIELDNGEAQRAAALAGAGIIYAPRLLVADDLAAGTLIPVLPNWRTISLPIHTVYPSRQFVPRRITALVEAIANGLRADFS